MDSPNWSERKLSEMTLGELHTEWCRWMKNHHNGIAERFDPDRFEYARNLGGCHVSTDIDPSGFVPHGGPTTP